MARLLAAFSARAQAGEAAMVAYVTAGHPRGGDDTVAVMLGLQRAGVDILELGVPHSDPIADGPTIQRSTLAALQNGVTLDGTMDILSKARKAGLTLPVVLFGYFNPFRAYGDAKLVKRAAQAGADGFLVVDLPPEVATDFRAACAAEKLSLVPLVAPTTSDDRMIIARNAADSFVYCVSVAGTTGARLELSDDLPNFVERVKRAMLDVPCAVGFGISTPAQFAKVAHLADGVVVGSALISALDDAVQANTNLSANELGKVAEDFARKISTSRKMAQRASPGGGVVAKRAKTAPSMTLSPQIGGMFGEFGGCFAPEILMGALEELTIAYEAARNDPTFHAEIRSYDDYVGRPTPLYHAKRLSDTLGGAQIWLKREDLAHTGAHKINNAVGQIILAQRLGKRRIIAETGAGQHGVATATVCAKLGFECVIYMGAEDIRRQSLNVFRMKMMGAKVVAVKSGSCTLKDAVNEAMRDWVTNIRTTHYLIGSCIGPHPFPTIVRDLQSVIGRESREQSLKKIGRLPDMVMACVGGGSNAIGMFHPFVADANVKIVGVEAGGRGLHTLDEHCATVCKGTPGVLHGTRSLLLQDADGQVRNTHSISAGLDYPSVGPEHAHFHASGRAEYRSCTDEQALEAFKLLCNTEGIIAALEPSHALYQCAQIAPTMPKTQNIVVCLSGRGDKDMGTLATALNVNLDD